MKNNVRIAVDAMGGDFGPSVVVPGAVSAAREGIAVLLVGDETSIKEELSKFDVDLSSSSLPITIKHASEVVEMDESPVKAIRGKRNSSLRLCFEAVKKNEASAVVSAGNSGAAMAAAVLLLKRLGGVERPAIAVNVPTVKKPAVVLDVGSNVDCKPIHMAHFAIMGDVYAKYVLNKARPRVGLLSNGAEASKGNELTRMTHDLIKKTDLNYIGYIEGKDIYSGDVDVVVTDGFVGNVVLKLSEGLVSAMSNMLKEELMAGAISKFGALLAKGAFKRFKKKFDYAEYGGAPLLGIDGNCMISHGSSSSKAIKNSILRASEFIEGKVNAHLVEELERNSNIDIVEDMGERRSV